MLIEVGVPGGRAGVRTFEQAADLIDRVMGEGDIFDFAGVECYEGLVAKDTYDETMKEVDRLLALTVECSCTPTARAHSPNARRSS